LNILILNPEIKKKLLSIPYVYKFNSIIKNFKFKKSYNKIYSTYPCDKYKKIAGELYSKKVKDLKILINSCGQEKLSMLWIGVIQSQDESGLIQSIRKKFHVTEFYNSHGDYGLEIHPCLGETELEMRSRNDSIFLDIINSASFDIIFGQFWNYALSSDVLLYARSKGIIIINLSMDDMLPNLWLNNNGIVRGACGLKEGVDLTLTTTPAAICLYAGFGMAARYFPLASCKEIFYGKPADFRDIDVLFIGNNYGTRKKIIRKLCESGVKVKCYGTGWGTKYLNVSEMAEMSKRAKIILGIGTVAYTNDVYTLKLRDFDSIMSGALYITHRNPVLTDLFIEGSHIECYEKIDELCMKVRYYLKNHAKRIKIAESGQSIACELHTWDNRINLLEEILIKYE
jgi:spore maturation protein CgeB